MVVFRSISFLQRVTHFVGNSLHAIFGILIALNIGISVQTKELFIVAPNAYTHHPAFKCNGQLNQIPLSKCGCNRPLEIYTDTTCYPVHNLLCVPAKTSCDPYLCTNLYQIGSLMCTSLLEMWLKSLYKLIQNFDCQQSERQLIMKLLQYFVIVSICQ